MALKEFRFALLQLTISDDKIKNFKRAENFIKNAKNGGANLILLPECFNSPYGNDFFPKNAENIPNGPTSAMLSKVARENSVYIVGGTFPEIENEKLYNTATVWNPKGELIAKYRKIHLYDIGIKGPDGISFNESAAFTSGENMCIFDFHGTKTGIIICHDNRFEEWVKLYRMEGIEMLIIPSNFDMTTGRMHWDILLQARAVDNLMYVLSISTSYAGEKGYMSWGHSTVVNPWGKIVAQAGHDEEILYCEIDLKEVERTRKEMPFFEQRKTNLYSTIRK